jgi:hypothetical protein
LTIFDGIMGCRRNGLIIQCKNLLTENSITDKPFTISEIKQCINILKSNKSAGPDLIANEN